MRRGPVEKYLQGYAEPDVGELPEDLGHWKHVVCIPACAEAGSLKHTLRTLSRVRDADKTLVVVVVNGRESAEASVQKSNETTWAELHEDAQLNGTKVSFGCLYGMGLLAVDRWSKGRWLPEGQGVGLARKIAGDIALSLIFHGRVENPWIRMTDADVGVPIDFFAQLDGVPNDVSAVIAPFVHVPEGDDDQRAAMAAYDVYLQSYVDGLQAAGSPYAFHTIGSLISVHARAYAAVRGVPRREAGEDFYLLNKLAKVGTVLSLSGNPIEIRGRFSDRVPFGTGAALNEMCTEPSGSLKFQAYDPLVFEGLATWLAALRVFVERPVETELHDSIRCIAAPLGPALYDTLTALGAFDAAVKASTQVSGEQLHRRLMEWNDAFRTLKLIHGLRERGVQGS